MEQLLIRCVMAIVKYTITGLKNYFIGIVAPNWLFTDCPFLTSGRPSRQYQANLPSYCKSKT